MASFHYPTASCWYVPLPYGGPGFSKKLGYGHAYSGTAAVATNSRSGLSRDVCNSTLHGLTERICYIYQVQRNIRRWHKILADRLSGPGKRTGVLQQSDTDQYNC